MVLRVEDAADLTILIRFLAAEEPLPASADWVILLGSAVLQSADVAMHAVQATGARLMVCGGVGHSTQALAATLGEPVQPEANLLAAVLRQRGFNGEILLETASTNCGANAGEARRVFETAGIQPRHVVLIQDPTMQRRSKASFERAWRGMDTVFHNQPALVPDIAPGEWDSSFPWDADRFVSLVLGEFPRFEAYGPRGADYIEAVEVPGAVAAAYERLCQRPFGPNARNRI